METPEPIKNKKAPPQPESATAVEEVGGAKRTTDPTRYNDWEINGKCVDF